MYVEYGGKKFIVDWIKLKFRPKTVLGDAKCRHFGTNSDPHKHMFHSILIKMLDTPCVGYIMQNVCRIWGQQIHCGSNETQILTKNRFWDAKCRHFGTNSDPHKHMFHSILTKMLDTPCVGCIIQVPSLPDSPPLPPLPYTIWTVPHERRDRETSTPVVWKPPGYKYT